MDSIKDRLQVFFQEQGISASEFADKIGVQRSSVSHILSERNKPSVDFIQKMIYAYPHMDIVWLLVGSKSGKYEKKVEQTTLSPKDVSFVKSHESLPHISLSEKTSLETTEKKIERIVIFYNDKSFMEYVPEV